MSLSHGIQELLTLDDIEEAEAHYQTCYGRPPFKLSDWNPSLYYENHTLLNSVLFPLQAPLIDYIYSYDLEEAQLSQIAEKLTGSTLCKPFITNSGTASIALTTSVLAALSCKRLLVISPTYFAVFYNCIQKGIGIREIHMLHVNQSYCLPRQDIISVIGDVDAIWITSPIYNTGIYMDNADIQFLSEYVLPGKYLIADESFCENGAELARQFGNSSHFIGIYDPMKQFLLNGAKFSAIMIPSDLYTIFCQWSDIICGSLSYSTLHAMRFFMSPESEQLSRRLRAENRLIQEKVRKTVSVFPDIFLDEASFGHMMMCYVPKIPANYLTDYADILQFQNMTGVSVIPGMRFHFPNQAGFAFRINAARYEPIKFEQALMCAAAHFSDYAP